MTTATLRNELTANEFEMLDLIVGFYEKNDNICYCKRLTPSEKGIVGSLVKKGLIYDYLDETIVFKSNFFPSEEVLEAFGIEC